MSSSTKTLHASPRISFSVVIPSFFGDSFIARSVHSALNQTFSPLEVIVVVDPPYGKTIEILEAIQDDRLVVVKNSVRIGLCDSRNVGWSVAKGSHVAFLDADDVWFSKKLEYQRSIIERFDPPLFSCENTYSASWKDEVISDREKITFLSPTKQMTKNHIHTSNAVVRRELPYRFNKIIRYCEDFPLWTTVIAHEKGCLCSNVVVSYYFEEPNKAGLSTDFSKNYRYGIKPGLRLLRKEGAINLYQYLLGRAANWVKYILRRIARRKVFANVK